MFSQTAARTKDLYNIHQSKYLLLNTDILLGQLSKYLILCNLILCNACLGLHLTRCSIGLQLVSLSEMVSYKTFNRDLVVFQITFICITVSK